MFASRTIILSQDEVGEAIKTFVRTKYHEKIENGYTLTDLKYDEQEKSISLVFSETISPFK